MTTLASALISHADLTVSPHRNAAGLQQPGALHGFGQTALAMLPGLLLTSVVAASAYGLRQLPGMTTFSPMILAILIGIAFHNLVGTPAVARPGVAFSLRRLLRIAIILLGLQLTITQVIEVGGRGIGIIATTLLATFAFTVWMGQLLGIDRKLAQLIAAGTSICGASAVIATNTVTNAHDEDVAYAVACVTVFGSVAMFAYPLLPGLLHLDPHAFGLWTGASIHEIAQVVAAAFQDGQKAGEFGTIAKLSRVMLLAPVVIALGLIAKRSAGKDASAAGASSARPPMPWFVLGFVALVGVNSLIPIPAEVKVWIAAATTFLLSVALAAMGLETDIRKLAAKGLRPALLGALAFLFIAGFSLTLIKLIG
ncbi:MAG TPA: YeiH family protein [Bradyrhizobium sp.]